MWRTQGVLRMPLGTSNSKSYFKTTTKSRIFEDLDHSEKECLGHSPGKESRAAEILTESKGGLS